jgi:hypothetical protein
MNAAGLVLARRLGAEAAAMSAYQIADHYAALAPRRWRSPEEGGA